MTSYLASLPDSFSGEQKTLLSDLFEWLVPACLKMIKDTPLNIRYSELHLFSSLTRILSAVLDVKSMKETGAKVSKNIKNDNFWLRQELKVSQCPAARHKFV